MAQDEKTKSKSMPRTRPETSDRTRTGTTIKVDMPKAYGFGYSDVATQLMSSLDMPVRNPDELLYRYREMAETDETVGAALEALCYSVTRKMGAYTHPDPRIAEIVELSMENLQSSIEEVRRALLADALSYGFGIGEYTLAPVKGLWVLSSVQVYDPATIKFKFARNENNALVVSNVIQSVGGQDINIPAHKCYITRHNAGTNPYGYSRLKRCWRWYSFKRVLPKFWAIALERFGMPMLVAKSDDPEALAEILQHAYVKAYASIGPTDSIEAVASQGQSGLENAYSAAIEFCNQMIYRAFFLPPLLESGISGGSYSLGKIHWRMFDDSCAWLARELVEVELESLWRPIIEWNFGPQVMYGEIPVVNTQTPEEQKIMSEIFLNAVNSGMIYPDQGDQIWMRDRLGFPVMPEGGEPDAWRAKLSQLEREMNSAPEFD